jgi:hypothetical protein
MPEPTESLYRICVRGRLSQTGAAWFEEFTLTVDETTSPPQTCLEGSMDQAALYGLISRIRDLGLTLVSVYPVASPHNQTENKE